ncbi:uncharacterized protein LOC124805766 isoform X1 [Hydra vulgaris]|uniref:uncharacterized protein LOC124805766 isoform X1 n=1 Tax=Hydra vulgaris TaxID=6087 RepID=UPI001F5EB5A7|nr:uncharacterized protein LOC124805766 isoform X1 [Hydra vulgaris]
MYHGCCTIMTTKISITPVKKIRKQANVFGQNKRKDGLYNSKTSRPQALNSQNLTTLVSTFTKQEQSTPILWASTHLNYNGFVIRKKSDSPPLQTSKKSSQTTKAIKFLNSHETQKNKLKLKPKISLNSTHVQQIPIKPGIKTSADQLTDNLLNCSYKGSLNINTSSFADTKPVNVLTDVQTQFYHNDATDNGNSVVRYSSENSENIKSRSSKCFKSNQDIPNHFCPKCGALMWKEKNEPYIIVPCGHSICLSCLPGQTHCIVCNCQITGSEQNKSLLSIIDKVQISKIQLGLENKEKEVHYYIAQFQSINKEIKLVQEENSSILNKTAAVEAELLKLKDDVEGIEEKSFCLKNKMKLLANKLTNLESEHASKTVQQTGLEQECSTLKMKFISSKERIIKLENTRDKVKFLVEGLCPSLRLKDYFFK